MNWLDDNSGHPGFQLLSDNEIAAADAVGDEEASEEDNDDDKAVLQHVPLYNHICMGSDMFIEMFIEIMEKLNINPNDYPVALGMAA